MLAQLVVPARQPPAEGQAYLARLEQELGLPAVDPVRSGVGRLVDRLA